MRYAPSDIRSSGFGLLVFSVLLFLSVALGGGCSLLEQEDGYSQQLKTDQGEYVADSSTTLRVTVTNTGERAVYYVCNGTIYLEALSGGEVTDSWKVHGFAECLRRTPIEPGSSATFTVSPFSSTGKLGVKIANLPKRSRYRLQMELYRSEKIDQLIAREARLSNTFTVTR